MPQAVIPLLINLAISVALGVISSLLAPKPKTPETNRDGRKQLIRSSVEEHQIIYGTSLESGPLVFAASSGSINEFLHLVVPLAAHEVEGVDSVFLKDVEITNADMDAPTGGVIGGFFAGKVSIVKHTGSDFQTADTGLVSLVPEWTTAHRGRGIAYLALRLTWDIDIFPQGIPNVRAVVRGRKVWDPRSDPGDPSVRSFSNNAALCQLDYLMSDFGFAVPLSEVHEASWVAAANFCDENVTLKAGGTQKRYTCDGSFQVGVKPAAIMEDLLTASAGALVYQQGQFRGYAGVATTPSGTIVESDLRNDGYIVDPRPSLSDSFNAIRGTYINADDPTAPYSLTDFPMITNATFQAQDNGVRVFNEIDLPFTTNTIRAQRLANLFLLRARQGIVVTLAVKLTKLNIAAWDVLTVTLASVGWVDKEFRVTQWALDDNGGISLTLQEEAPEVYDWDFNDEIDFDPAPDTNLPNPFTAVAPTNLVLTSGTAALFLKADGTVVSRIKASWTASIDSFINRYEVQFRATIAAPDWQPATLPSNQTHTFILDVEDGIAYDVRVRGINTLGVRTPWLTVTNHIVVGKTAVPADVSGFVIAAKDFNIRLSWDSIPDIDLKNYEIRRGSTWAAGTFESRPGGTSLIIDALLSGTTDFMIKAFDTSGNESTTEASVSFTVNVPGTPAISSAFNGSNFELSWVTSKGSYAIRDYEIRRGGSSFGTATFVATTDGTTYITPVDWIGTEKWWVRATDIIDNTGSASSIDLTIVAPSVSGFMVQVIDNTVLLMWVGTPGSLPIRDYNIRKGTVFASAQLIGTQDSTFTTILETIKGVFTYWVQPRDAAGNEGTEVSLTATVDEPPDFVFRNEFAIDWIGNSVNLKKLTDKRVGLLFDGDGDYVTMGDVLDQTGSFTIEAVIRPDNLAKVGGQRISAKDTLTNGWAFTMGDPGDGKLRFFIREGTPVSTDGNIILEEGKFVHVAAVWDSSAGRKKIYVGGVLDVDIAATGDAVNNTAALAIGADADALDTFFEGVIDEVRLWDDVRTLTEINDNKDKRLVGDETNLVGYWRLSERSGIIAEDQAGSDFDGNIVDATYFVPVTTAVVSINLTETIDDHFDVNNSFVSPQAQIDAGFAYWLEPTLTSASIEEVYDLGTVVTSSRILVDLSTTTIDGSPTFSITISERKLAGDSWSDFATGSTDVFATDFRYIKVALSITTTAGVDFAQLNTLLTTLRSKIKSDAGTVTVSANPTTVNFNVTFVDIQGIVVTPQGTVARIAVVDFSDVPSPTSFDIHLFDAAGSAVTGDVRWEARGF